LGEKYDVISPYDLGIDLEVEENDYSLIENSTNKALAWAKKSGLVTLSEDSGFFIKKLN
jgi:inosine/xanthosine triphosphate pyrophosphatase family protein